MKVVRESSRWVILYKIRNGLRFSTRLNSYLPPTCCAMHCFAEIIDDFVLYTVLITEYAEAFWPSNSRCLCPTLSLYFCFSPLRIFRFTLNLILQSRRGGGGISSRSGTYSVRSESLSCVGTTPTIARLSMLISLLLDYKFDAYLSLIYCLFPTVAFRESIG